MREKVSGCRTERLVLPGGPASTTGSRPTSAANATPPSTVLIGPQGTPAAISSSNHSLAVFAASRAASSGRS